MLSMRSDKLILSAFPRGHKNIPGGMGRKPAHTLWPLSHCSLSSPVLLDERFHPSSPLTNILSLASLIEVST